MKNSGIENHSWTIKSIDSEDEMVPSIRLMDYKFGRKDALTSSNDE